MVRYFYLTAKLNGAATIGRADADSSCTIGGATAAIDSRFREIGPYAQHKF
jgi:hypothetical protein